MIQRSLFSGPALFTSLLLLASNAAAQSGATGEAPINPNESGWVVWETTLLGRNIRNLSSLTIFARPVVSDDETFGEKSFSSETAIAIGRVEPNKNFDQIAEPTTFASRLGKKRGYIEDGKIRKSTNKQAHLTGAFLPPGDYVITEMQFLLPSSALSSADFAGNSVTDSLGFGTQTAAPEASKSLVCFNDTSYLFTVRPGQRTFLGKIDVRVPFSGARQFRDFIPVESIDLASASSYPVLQQLDRTEVDEVKLDTEGSHCTRNSRIYLAQFTDKTGKTEQ